MDRAVGDDPLAHTAPQIARHQHPGRRIERIVAIPVLLVAEADFQGILVTGGADQPDHGPLVLDQRVEPDRRAVDAQVAFRDHLPLADAEILGDQPQPAGDRRGRIVWRRERLEEPDVAPAVRKHEVGEGATGIDTKTVFGAHRPLPY